MFDTSVKVGDDGFDFLAVFDCDYCVRSHVFASVSMFVLGLESGVAPFPLTVTTLPWIPLIASNL
ncbi:hypothetical protein SDC9_178127 [bioreactor metagenome]|uniref:Uncharacterized protein n=1 Tax=bioreactor metagenome TaxID=1076179 RepID=A0A645GWL6_9ZZZZ